jgi:hypothetical protein
MKNSLNVTNASLTSCIAESTRVITSSLVEVARRGSTWLSLQLYLKNYGDPILKEEANNNGVAIAPSEFAPISHPISHRRSIGAFYTPFTVSTALSKWGIRTKSDRILEPCFGGCTFLEAAIERFKAFGHTRTEKNLFGCDLDPLAFQYLRTKIANDALMNNFFLQDFMSFAPHSSDQREQFDLVIGNPPYIRHGKFGSQQRETLEAWRNLYGININRRASLWAYFVMHSLNFLKHGGRVAWVLPGSFLHADYAASIREALSSKFKRILAITIAERLFVSEGTEETTVVLLAEGYGLPPQANFISTICVDSLADFVQFLDSGCQLADLSERVYTGHGMVPQDAATTHFALSQHDSIVNFGDIANLSIGLVVGDTKFFVKSKADWKKEKIDRQHLRYILPRSQWVSGIELTIDDATFQINSNVPCLALNSPSNPRAETLLRYLNSYDISKRKGNATFGKREPWYQFFDNKIPDAFFVFMTSLGPRVVLNSTPYSATNSVYRVFFKEGITLKQRKLAAISIHSTFSQLSAEIEGYARGSGALKLEPSTAQKIRIAMPAHLSDEAVNKVFFLLNTALREKLWDQARKIADEFLFEYVDDTECLNVLERGLLSTRNRRMRK